MIYHPDAMEELDHAMAYYNQRRSGLGIELLDKVIEAELQIVESPRRWPEIEPGFRKLNLKRFPYRLIYEIVEGKIEVIAFMHQKQRPGYWRIRIKKR